MKQQALDPFCGHEWTVQKPTPPRSPGASQASGWFSTRKQEEPPHEMQNRAERADLITDPFMTKRGVAADRARVKVSVFSASDLPARGERTEPYCTIQVPNVPKSRLNTPVDYQNWTNPVWNFTEKQVWGWIPGKPLEFEVKNKGVKTGGGFSSLMGTAEDLVLGTAILQPDQFWPAGYRSEVELRDHYGAYAGKLWVEVTCLGGEAAQRGVLSWLADSLRTFGDELAAIPILLRQLVAQCFELLKPEYPGRKLSEMVVLMYVPFGVYSVVTLMLCALRRYIETLCYGVIGAMCCLFLAFIVFAYTRGKKAQGLPYSTLGCLCLLAVLLGIGAGNDCWDFGWQQWFWMNTGHGYGVNATSSAAASIDAATVAFDAETSVDSSRAAGFRHDYSIYCAAPMLDPQAAGVENPRVSFWAIGINCCNDFGSFTCDASRTISGGMGVVMYNKGMPCSGCNRDQFRLAIRKAAGAYNLISDPDALLVKYVRNKSVVEVEYGIRSFGILLLYLFLGFCIFATLGYVANFKGWGKPAANVEGIRTYNLARDAENLQRQKTLQRERDEKELRGSRVPRIC